MAYGHLRSTFIGETLARMLEYSGVVVLRKRIHVGDHLDIEGKSSYDLYIGQTLDLLRGKGLTIVSEGEDSDRSTVGGAGGAGPPLTIEEPPYI
ncbi:anticodon-binding aminoacyl-tRNA synthetase, class 1a [Tanacetum coccineum]|uniref:Anticodon-binding aminoacyl-tRNA synthetase, class 1a n=1 Tax=Tanacetum coccineum TaxID=301880 RepID=A0ABQ5G5D1_9ASTR